MLASRERDKDGENLGFQGMTILKLAVKISCTVYIAQI